MNDTSITIDGNVDGALEVVPLSGALGAEIHGVDLASELSDATIAAIRQAWLDHLVVFFRDQNLGPDEFLGFARRIGEPVEYPFVRGIDGYPEIIAVDKLPHETVNFGGIWHSDTTYLARPPMGTMLIAREVPPAGGDTLFASMYAAHETLSPGMQRMLGGIRAVSTSALADVSKTREDRIRDNGNPTAETETFEAEHPVVRTHPETGRKALYVNPAHTARFADMTEEESAPLLQYLFEHAVRPRAHLPLPLGRRLDRAVGQPLRVAQPDQRLRRLHPPHASHHAGRRRSALSFGSALPDRS